MNACRESRPRVFHKTYSTESVSVRVKKGLWFCCTRYTWSLNAIKILFETTRSLTAGGWPTKAEQKWQDPSLTSNQTKLNKTFPLRQRTSKIPTRATLENFSRLTFSSASLRSGARFPKQRQIIISMSPLPVLQRSACNRK